MWPSTEVNKVADTKHACKLRFSDLLLNELDLEMVVAEQIKGLLLRDDQSLEWMIPTNDLRHGLLDGLVILSSPYDLAGW